MAAVERNGEGTFVYDELHGGVGKILVQRYFEGAHPWKMNLELWELPVGANEGAHVHDESEPEYGAMSELYLIVEGTARMIIAGVPVEFGPGDAALAASGIEHDLVNTGTVALRVLVITDPEIANN